MSQQEPETTQQYPRPRRRAGRASPVTGYLAILFAAAFLLLLWAYFQQQRSNAEATDALKQSVSAVQSIQDLIADNDALRLENEAMKEQLETLKDDNKALKDQLFAEADARARQEATVAAMDWFWQIDEAYVRGRYALCRQLIEELRQSGYEDFLPDTKFTDNSRYSPKARYEEICGALY